MNSYGIMRDQRRATRVRRRKGAETDFLFSMGFSLLVGVMLGAMVSLMVLVP